MKERKTISSYREYVGLVRDIVKTEITNKNTIQTIEEYEVWAHGIMYRIGNEIKKIEDYREKVFVGSYTQTESLALPRSEIKQQVGEFRRFRDLIPRPDSAALKNILEKMKCLCYLRLKSQVSLIISF